jgi:pyruvate dehydrogenase (quinone)
LIVGSTFPYIEYYPKPGQAHVVQIDRDAARIGLRAPVEVGLVGDAKAALEMLNARLIRKRDRSFLTTAQERMEEWRRLLHESSQSEQFPLKPGRIAREVGEHISSTAIVTWDSGHNTGLLARYIEAQDQQTFGGSGMLASMGCAVPYAIAAALAFPDRQVVAFVGDGGFTMSLCELATIVRYRLPIKIIVVKNNTLGQIKWEQMMFLGHPEYECDLQPIDFAKVAEGFGLKSFSIQSAAQCGEILEQAMSHRGPALIEAPIDANEPLLPPKRIREYAENIEKALEQGTDGQAHIRQALQQEPARTMLQ